MSTKISVEVFRDAGSASTVAGFGEQSVDLVNYFAKNLEVSRANRSLRLGEAATPLVMDTIKWPRFAADLNLVITSRDLVSDGNEVLGSAQASTGKHASVAVISTTSPSPELTGAHELGHLLHLRDRTNIHDIHHCQLEDCLMSSTQKTTWAWRDEPQKRMRRFLRRHHTQPLLSEPYETDSNRTFCPPCIDQLAKKAFFLASLYDGNDLAIKWLEQ